MGPFLIVITYGEGGTFLSTLFDLKSARVAFVPLELIPTSGTRLLIGTFRECTERGKFYGVVFVLVCFLTFFFASFKFGERKKSRVNFIVTQFERFPRI